MKEIQYFERDNISMTQPTWEISQSKNGKEQFTISLSQNEKENFTISPSQNGKEHFTISPSQNGNSISPFHLLTRFQS